MFPDGGLCYDIGKILTSEDYDEFLKEEKRMERKT